ncbi:MAG: epoxyqueuosine reductase QueH, partial [Kiritimatiellae bacterium]|nr:epoxyqueuosine reductase QueH [Kiritimatiellia bacterium]
PPDHAEWLETVAKGFEQEPEGGARCARCFRYSLTRAAALRARHGCDLFTTSLTVSPHKSSPTLFAVGREVDAEHFLPIDFKKKNGFLDSIRRAAEYGLYRQNYCGCEFSLAAQRKEVPHG